MAYILKAESGDTSYFNNRTSLSTKLKFTRSLFTGQFASLWSGLDIDQLTEAQIQELMALFNTYEFCEKKCAIDLPDLYDYLTGDETFRDDIHKINESLKINAPFLRTRMSKDEIQQNKERVAFIQQALSSSGNGNDYRFLEAVI